MTERTFNIIMASKGNFDKLIGCKVEADSSKLSPCERVFEYMSVECGTPKSHYTTDIQNKIMVTAMCDYLNTCDNPGYFIQSLSELFDKDLYSYAEQIATAFELVQVMEDGKYINGFEEYYKDTTLDEAERKKAVAEFVTNTAQKLNQYKDYEVGYGTPKNGKMIVHYKSTNYLVDVQALDNRSIEEDMKIYDFLFKDRSV